MRNEKNEWFCDGCGEFIDSGNVRYADDGVQLCELCYEECRAASEGAQKHIAQHTQAKMPSFEEMRKSCIERGICSEDGFYTNHFDTGFKAAYNCIARHFGCA